MPKKNWEELKAIIRANPELAAVELEVKRPRHSRKKESIATFNYEFNFSGGCLRASQCTNYKEPELEKKAEELLKRTDEDPDLLVFVTEKQESIPVFKYKLQFPLHFLLGKDPANATPSKFRKELEKLAYQMYQLDLGQEKL